MADEPKLLVVDDEAVICQACRRIFARQGFRVEEALDPREGLSRARDTDYAGILLDIKMPAMDGIQFLEELRKTKPDVPVMIMTGYPSIPNAAAAVRLGASDYITKPFTPEEVTQAVRRMLACRPANGRHEAAVAGPIGEALRAEAVQRLFWDEAWMQPEVDGSACIGAVLVRRPGVSAKQVRLPEIGEVAYQGLPLAGVVMSDDSQATVPSPVSGVVVGVNELLAKDAGVLTSDPCGTGWIACVCTTRLDEETRKCSPRRVILVSGDDRSVEQQAGRLAALGCDVRRARGWEDLHPLLDEAGRQVVLLDEASLGEEGPELAARAAAAVQGLKIVVIAGTPPRYESAYREARVFYYAVEPFADGEILFILDAVFRGATPAPQAEREGRPSEPLSGIRITNRNGHKVHLLASPGLLRHGDGLGGRIHQTLTRRAFPVVTTPGEMEITPANVLKVAGTCDRVMVLLTKDSGRLPGSLMRDTKAEYVTQTRENAARVTTLAVQPDPKTGTLVGLDDRTTSALSEHIVQEMASY